MNWLCFSHFCSYITWMDVEVMFLLGVVVFTVVEYMVVHFMSRKDMEHDKDQQSAATRLDQWCRCVIPPLVILGSTGLTVVGFLMGGDHSSG